MPKSTIVRGVLLAAASSLFAVASCGGGSDRASTTSPTDPTPSDAGGASRVDASSSCASDPSRCTDAVAPTADAASEAGAPPFFVVLSAMPVELAPILAKASITSTQVLGGRTFHVGTLKGARVALAITGVGLTNAAAAAHDALAQFPATGVLFSGTAGSKLRIGDVAVPSSWSLGTTGTHPADPKWLALASSVVASGSLCFESCTAMPSTGVPVCLDHVPGVLVGGVGQSDDASVAIACKSGGDDVFGCEVGAPAGAAEQCKPAGAALAPGDAGAAPIVNDNETAAVAAEAALRGLPFLAFRGVSDGAGDPLNLPGYPTQFFAYYRLAARNAAIATIAYIERAASTTP